MGKNQSSFHPTKSIIFFFAPFINLRIQLFFSSERWRRLVSSFFRFKVSTRRRVGQVGVAPSCSGGRATDHARGELSLGRRSFVRLMIQSLFSLQKKKNPFFWRLLENVCLKNVSYDLYLFVLTRPSIIVRLVSPTAT